MAQAQELAAILGQWLGPEDPDGNRSTIEVFPCADQFCGRVSAVTLDTSRVLLGQTILSGLRQQAPDRYVGGRIRFDHVRWRFSGTVHMLSADQLTMRVCWAGLICQTLPYERVEA